MARGKKSSANRIRYGIGEWYGKSFVALTSKERAELTAVRSPSQQPCIPQSTDEKSVPCKKKGGVCSLRLYEQDQDSDEVRAIVGEKVFSTLCPHRFKEDGLIFEWVSEKILNHQAPKIVTEVGFLIRESLDEADGDATEDKNSLSDIDAENAIDYEDVGQIDYVLIHPDQDHMHWCALELQAVYFSGRAMSNEFENIRNTPADEIPFPKQNRRPDFRSSGPKRLMPQLQIKVPALRRWGKKMAVVVDKKFFSALGKMDHVTDISNCDIIWFIVDYRETDDKVELILDNIRYTTLERAVEGLTAGRPVGLSDFERRIIDKLSKSELPKRKKSARSSK